MDTPKSPTQSAQPPRFRKARGVVIRMSLFFMLLWIGGCRMIWMPGDSYSGELPPLSDDEEAIKLELVRDVLMLSEVIGPRNVERPKALKQADDYISEEFRIMGIEPTFQAYTVKGVECRNIEIVIEGQKNPDEILVVGAHYDSCDNSPGANDNASAVAAVLAVARRYSIKKPDRTIRFVAFVNEEPPRFQTEEMGSLVYAKACRERGDDIKWMLSLDTVGYFDDAKGSQHYPAPFSMFYPDTGNFIAFVSNGGSKKELHSFIRTFRREVDFPSEGVAAPGGLQGIGWSDHWSFWEVGYPAIMMTDTAPFRYPYYHTSQDTADKIDFDRLARVVHGLDKVLDVLSAAE